LSVPPKGKSAEYLAREFPELAKRYWGKHLWALGYCVSTVGINEEAVWEYVQGSRRKRERKKSKDYGKTTMNYIVRSCRL